VCAGASAESKKWVSKKRAKLLLVEKTKDVADFDGIVVVEVVKLQEVVLIESAEEVANISKLYAETGGGGREDEGAMLCNQQRAIVKGRSGCCGRNRLDWR
jgi:hypothetical protein